jgi:pimeloyl-ACP methyl ester carboxylesterase/lysophospholipase L1-like esterase
MKKIFLTLSTLVFISVLNAAEKVAFLGDSITYSGRWAMLVESALRETPRFADAEMVNFGLSSETVSGLSEPGHAGGAFPRPCLHERLTRILDAFPATVVIACYGMNDGIQMSLDRERQLAYQKGIVELKRVVEARGAHLIFVTAPLFYADQRERDGKNYDAVLDDQAAYLLQKRNPAWSVIDIRPDLRRAIASQKQREPSFVFSADGVHPGPLGHSFMAQSILPQLWPILKLPGKPWTPDEKSQALLQQRADILKHAWLTKTGHKRPGVPAGKPLDQAQQEADALMTQYKAAITPRTSQWNGFEKLDFTVAGRAALLVKPKQVATDAPWVWRTEFFGHEPQADLALLAKGYHVAYIDVQNLYGAPVAMQAMDDFHAHLTARFALSERCVLFGFSRGGLFAFNWAARNPQKTAGLYVDAPVCDFKSWPGAKGKGPGSAVDWERCLKAYGFTEEQAIKYELNPVDNLSPLAKAKIPILAVIGDADEVVPVPENIDIVEKRYLALGGPIKVIRKPGGKHHPHSLKDPQPIVDFVLNVFR